MIMTCKRSEGMDLLVKALLALRTEEECRNLLDDLMTRKEVEDIAQRLLVAKMLSEQAVYNKIVEKTGASTATISRVNRSFHYGADGYAVILERIKEEQK